jgi:hypothetical protein
MAIYVTEHTLTGMTDAHLQSLQPVFRQDHHPVHRCRQNRFV